MKNPTLKFLFEKLDETITEAEKDCDYILLNSAISQSNAIGDAIASIRDIWEELDDCDEDEEEPEGEPDEDEPVDDSVDEPVNEVSIKVPIKEPDEESKSYQQMISANGGDDTLDPAYVIAELNRMGLSQAEIARRIGVCPKTICNYKLGRQAVSKPVQIAIENLLQIERVKRGECE